MRHLVVRRQLNPLRIDHDEAQVVRRVMQQQARDDGVDAHRLARAGGPGDQQVRHGGQVGGHGVARDVLPQRQTQPRIDLEEGLGLHHVPQRHHLDLVVGNLDPDEPLARHRRLDPNRRRRQRQRQIVGQRADLADLDLHPPAAAAFGVVGLDAELGDRRAAVDLDHAHRRPEGQQRFFDHAAALPVERLVGASLGALVEN